MDIHRPRDWIEAFLENVPEQNRESFGQMQLLREYGDCISSLPESEQKKLWAEFQEALDERFPSRRDSIVHAPDKPKPIAEKASDEQIVESVLHVFSAPGDQSADFHEMLFRRAMGLVEQELREEAVVSRWLRRRRIRKGIRRWMDENLD